MVCMHQIKKIYLDNPMEDPEYFRIKITDIQKSLFWSMGLLEKKTRMGGSTLKFVKATMGCPKLAF